MDQDPIAKLDAFMMREEELFSFFDRERAIRLARVISLYAVGMSLFGVVLMVGLFLTGVAHFTHFYGLTFIAVAGATAISGIGLWCAYHDDQYGAAFAVVGAMLFFALGFQAIWQMTFGLDAVASVIFMLTALPIGLSGVLGEPRLMFITAGSVSILDWVACFVLPGHEHASPAYRFIIAGVAMFVQLAIAVCISLAAYFYIKTLKRANIFTEAYKQLRYLDQMKDTFIDNVNHELRTPFMTLSASTEMLYMVDSELSLAERSAYLNMAYRSIERLRAILDAVLNFQRVGAGIATVSSEVVSVRRVVDDAVALAELMVPLGTHPLRLDVSREVRIWGNSALLQEALVNLLTNAHKYSPPNAPIEIVAYERQLHGQRPYVELRVRDHGAGIPREQAHLLFRRLSRLPRDVEGKVPGSGLGLAITKMVIEAMHGSVRFESTGIDGQGTVFIITLPVPVVERQPVHAVNYAGSTI